MNRVFVVSYILDNGAKTENKISCVCAKDKTEAKKFLEKEIIKDCMSYCTIISIREIEYGEVI